MTVHPQLRPIVATIVVLAALGVGVPLVLLGLVTPLPWWLGIVLGLLAGVAALLAVVRGRTDRALASFGPVADCDDERLANLVEGLSLSIGVEEPSLLVVSDPAANAAVLADDERRYVIVTDTLLRTLDRMGLEGVVAELLVRIKEGDATLSTEAAGSVGPLIDGPLAAVLGGPARRALAEALDDDRDMLADQAAAVATRYPPGLAAALAAIETVGFRPAAANRRNDHLWIVPPLGDDAVVRHVPLEWRVDMLLEI